MPKGYWIARLDVTDAETYKAYVKANAEAFAKYGAKFLTRGGPFTPLEGQNRSRNIVLEFDSVETALACYRSPEYQRAFEMRRNAAVADIIVMPGYDGPQPPEQPGEAASVESVESAEIVVRMMTGQYPPLKREQWFTDAQYNDIMGGALA